MTMPRRGSRRITVNDVSYRFKVNGQQKINITVTVEETEHPGHVMIARFPTECEAVGTTEIQAVIQYARIHGWNPWVMHNFQLGVIEVREALHPVNMRR